ncbi:MAG: RNA methyltransferase [Saprospiraceae bacterium]
MQKLNTEELERHDAESFQKVGKYPIVLLLDNVRSGLNVGSVFRTADAFACEQVVLCGITAQPPHREILKTALGSTETVAWQHFPNNTDALAFYKDKGYKIYCVEQGIPRTWLQDFKPEADEKVVLVFGNEVDGVDEALLPLCDGMIEIPQFGTKHSLNISVAAGIAVWETVKNYI